MGDWKGRRAGKQVYMSTRGLFSFCYRLFKKKGGGGGQKNASATILPYFPLNPPTSCSAAVLLGLCVLKCTCAPARVFQCVWPKI